MSECTHDCSTCQENCGERQEQDLRAKLNPAASVKKGHCRRQRQRAASARASLPAFLQARCRAADIRRLCLMRISPAPPSLSHLASTSMRAAPRICSSPAIQTRARRSCPLTLFSTTRPTPSFGAVLSLQALLLSSGATCCGMMLTTCLSICLPEQATFL